MWLSNWIIDNVPALFLGSMRFKAHEKCSVPCPVGIFHNGWFGFSFPIWLSNELNIWINNEPQAPVVDPVWAAWDPKGTLSIAAWCHREWRGIFSGCTINSLDVISIKWIEFLNSWWASPKPQWWGPLLGSMWPKACNNHLLLGATGGGGVFFLDA